MIFEPFVFQWFNKTKSINYVAINLYKAATAN